MNRKKVYKEISTAVMTAALCVSTLSINFMEVKAEEAVDVTTEDLTDRTSDMVADDGTIGEEGGDSSDDRKEQLALDFYILTDGGEKVDSEHAEDILKPTELIDVVLMVDMTDKEGNHVEPANAPVIVVNTVFNGFMSNGNDEWHRYKEGFVKELRINSESKLYSNPSIDVTVQTISGEATSQASVTLNMSKYLTENGEDNGSDNSSEGTEGDGSSSESTELPVPAVTENKDTVTLSGGKSVRSTIGGVYSAQSVKGMAVTTPVEDVRAAAGISDEETNIRLYAMNSRDRDTRDALKEGADTCGKRVAAYVTTDMYSITKKGVVAPIKKTSAPVTIMFGLPDSLRNTENSYSVIFMDSDGKMVTFTDLDTDSATVTIEATVFGTYAIIY